MIKVFGTEYNGYRFHSRLEARWAVLFDAMGIRYKYDYESFTLDGGCHYHPSFLLPGVNVRLFEDEDRIAADQAKISMENLDVWVNVEKDLNDYELENATSFGNDCTLPRSFRAGHELDEDEKAWTVDGGFLVVSDVPNYWRFPYNICVEHRDASVNYKAYLSSRWINGTERLCFPVVFAQGDSGLIVMDAKRKLTQTSIIFDLELTQAAYRKARYAGFEHGWHTNSLPVWRSQ